MTLPCLVHASANLLSMKNSITQLTVTMFQASMWNSPMYHIRLRTAWPHGDIWSQRNSLSAAKTKPVSLRHALGACSPRQFQSQIRRVPSSQLHLPCNPLQRNAPPRVLPQQSKLLKDNVLKLKTLEAIETIDVTWKHCSTLRTTFVYLRQISSKPRRSGSCTA